MHWKLWYADGSTFSSDDGAWADAPARGVQALVTPDDVVGREVDTGDFYLWWPGASKPWSADTWGVMDYLLQTLVIGPHERVTDLPYVTLRGAGVKFGRSLDNARFREVYARAAADPDFPTKSGRYAHERR